MQTSRQLPVVLTVAGSDNSSGAGIQADLKTFSALGTYGLTALTCVVAEIPGRVEAIEPMPPQLVRRQIELCFSAFPVAAMKTGMLWSAEIIRTVAELLEEKSAEESEMRKALVIDPVMVASSGAPLLQNDAVEICQQELFPLASVVTPNLDEAQALLKRPIKTLEQMREAGTELALRFQVPFLIKGGHLHRDSATDLLVFPDGEIHDFTSPYIEEVELHGTGCCFSAAIAAALAKGEGLTEAVRTAKGFIDRAIETRLAWGKGASRIVALNQVPSPP